MGPPYLSCSAIAMTTSLFFSLTAASRILSFVLFKVISDLSFDRINVTTEAWPLMAARCKAVFCKKLKECVKLRNVALDTDKSEQHCEDGRKKERIEATTRVDGMEL